MTFHNSKKKKKNNFVNGCSPVACGSELNERNMQSAGPALAQIINLLLMNEPVLSFLFTLK